MADVIRTNFEMLKRPHRYVEDCWYSCPMAEDGCCDESQGEECNCGAEQHNALVDSMVEYVKSTERREQSIGDELI